MARSSCLCPSAKRFISHDASGRSSRKALLTHLGMGSRVSLVRCGTGRRPWGFGGMRVWLLRDDASFFCRERDR